MLMVTSLRRLSETTEESGEVLDELRRVTSLNILDGYPAKNHQWWESCVLS